MSQDSSPPSESWLHSLPSARTCALVLAGTVVLAYGRLWWAGFIWDDDDYVINNSRLRSLAGLARIWLVPGSTSQYYPLTHTSFWIEYQLWGLKAPFYHFINVLLHAANALLLWAVLHRLAVPAPWLGATLFAIHPVEVESVAWISERKNTLSACFGLLFMLAWLRYRFALTAQSAFSDHSQPHGEKPIDVRWLAVATALFLASLLCKTVTITLIGVVLVISWWKTGRISRADLIGITPLIVIGLPLALTTVAMEKTTVGAVGEEWSLTPADRIVLAGRVIVFYLSKLVWPQPLIFFYPRWTVAAAAVWQWVFPIGVAAVLAVLWFLRGRLGRGPLAYALLFIGMLFPALGFFDVYPFQYSYVADHFQYHASAAALAGFGAMAWLAAARLSDVRLKIFVIAGWIVVLCGLTVAQTAAYVSLEQLYRHVLSHDPTSYAAANNLGNLYSSNNRLDDAIHLFERAAFNARSKRQKGLALWNVCTDAVRAARLDIARQYSEEAYSLLPTVASRSMRALVLVRSNAVDEAARLLEDPSRDVDENRVAPDALIDINRLAHAEVAVARGDTETATAYLDALVADSTREWMKLQAGIAYGLLGELDKAAHVFGALRDSPVYAGCAYVNLGVLALKRKNTEVAEVCFRAAADKDHALPDAPLWLSRILLQKKRFVDAEVVLVKALRFNPDDRQLAEALAAIREAAGVIETPPPPNNDER